MTFKSFERSHLSLLLKKIRLYLSQCSVRQSRNLLWASYPDGDQSFLSRGRKCNASAWKDFFIVMQKQDFPAEQTFSFWRKTHQYFRVLGTEKFLTIRPNSIDYFFSKEVRIGLAWFLRCNWNLSHFGQSQGCAILNFGFLKVQKYPLKLAFCYYDKRQNRKGETMTLLWWLCVTIFGGWNIVWHLHFCRNSTVVSRNACIIIFNATAGAAAVFCAAESTL